MALLKDGSAVASNSSGTTAAHAPLSRAGQPAGNSKSSLPANAKSQESDISDVLVTQYRKLLTTNLVVRLNNFTLWKVSTSKVKVPPREFLSGKVP